MTFVKFKAQIPLQKTVTFTNKVMELGDSYIQRRTSEKVTTVYSVTSEPLTKKERDYYEKLFADQTSILWQPYEGIALSYFKAINYSFEQVTSTLFLLKVELELMENEVCGRLVNNINVKTENNKFFLEKAWAFIFKYTSGAFPRVATALFQATRYFNPVVTFHRQLINIQLTTSKDYFLLFETILDLYLIQKQSLQISYIMSAIEEYIYNPMFLYEDVPNTDTNLTPFWLPNATYTTRNANPEKFFIEGNARGSGIIASSRTFTNGVYTFPASTTVGLLSKVYRVFNGTLKLNRVDSPLATGTNYEIQYYIDNNNFVLYPDGYRVLNSTGLPKNTIKLKTNFTGDLLVNYTTYDDIQTIGTKPYYPHPVSSERFGNTQYYYAYTSFFILDFYRRISKVITNFRLERSVKALEYTLPLIYANISTQAIPYTPGIAPTYCFVQFDAQNNKYPTWYGFFFVFEQNENFWRLLPNKTLEAQNVLAFKLAAMDDFESRGFEDSWLFTPIYISTRPDEPFDGNINNVFVDKYEMQGVDNGYSLESQYNIIVNTAEYLFHNPLNEIAQTIVTRWINGIYIWFRNEYRANRFRPPSFIYSNPQFPPSGFEDSPTTAYSAAMILRVAIYANLAGIASAKTIWLIFEMNEYLLNSFEDNGLMAGSWTKKSTRQFIVNDIPQNVFKEMKNEHHFEIIRTLVLLENQKQNLKYPSCADFDALPS